MKYQLDSLLQAPVDIQVLELHSFEMNVYLVKVKLNDEIGLVYEGDAPKRFHSTQHVRDTFENCQIREAFMVHESPYDEMIGNPPKSERAMVLPFSMEQPY